MDGIDWAGLIAAGLTALGVADRLIRWIRARFKLLKVTWDVIERLHARGDSPADRLAAAGVKGIIRHELREAKPEVADLVTRLVAGSEAREGSAIPGGAMRTRAAEKPAVKLLRGAGRLLPIIGRFL